MHETDESVQEGEAVTEIIDIDADETFDKSNGKYSSIQLSALRPSA